jgi:hypothetical protein
VEKVEHEMRVPDHHSTVQLLYVTCYDGPVQ